MRTKAGLVLLLAFMLAAIPMSPVFADDAKASTAATTTSTETATGSEATKKIADPTQEMLKKASGGRYRPVTIEEGFSKVTDKGTAVIAGLSEVTGIVAVIGILAGVSFAVVGSLLGFDALRAAGIGALVMGFIALIITGGLWYWVGTAMSLVPQ
ncbi:hypothetical protein GTO91_15745 [Heliobacterium undosum]|uniref:Uncharacterized protein n=1 Tax=Heliomicrobium undosum TaxID=121734 RepID=A0A845L960_9FIRM|nr:hypothetical protein [Heliomicrobium undosum]MZP31160.1 hypothetical protein [Heliomicrobium undosum]